MIIEGRSYAKINWTLEILGKRPDGYHEVRTILQSINLHDTLHFEKTESEIETICDDAQVPVDESNLIHRAARMLRDVKGIGAGVRVRVVKRIPVAAGLGGGSSNAAVTLLALQQLWSVTLSAEELLHIGTQLGADVPFFFYGGTAVGIGRGSEVYPLPDGKAAHMLLIWPKIEVSTRAAYAAWSARQRQAAIESSVYHCPEDNPSELTIENPPANIPACCVAIFRAYGLLLAEKEFVLGQESRNDLEAAVVDAHLEIGRIFGRLWEAGAKRVRLSGSGSAVFAVFDSVEELKEAEKSLANEPWQLIPTRTVGRKEYWETLMRVVSSQELVVR